MTSAEFLAKYRVLKTLTEHGARTQIAQEVALGRMVMVHHLDVGTSAECQRLAAKVGRLTPDAASKVFDVVTVDGTQVIVTHFLATFIDLPSWLEQNSASPDPLEAKTVLMEAPELSTPRETDPAPIAPAASIPPASRSGGFTALFGASAITPPPPGSPPAAQKGAFTEVFGGTKQPPAPAGPPAAPSRAANPAVSTGDVTRVFQGTKPPATGPAPAAETPPLPARPPEPSFTSLFGEKQSRGAEQSSPVFRSSAPGMPGAGPSGPPVSPNAARFGSVMPPVDPSPPPRPASAPPPAPAVNPASDDFNALFARLDPAGSSQPPAPSPAPPAFTQPPAPPAPSLGAPSFVPSAVPPSAAPPAAAWRPPVAPPLPPMGSGGAPARGPSEFTRILGRGQMPPIAPPGTRVPDANNSSTPGFPTPAAPKPQAPPPAKSTKSYLPVIIALNLVLIAAILVVVYFVTRR
jgi:hypothetical protein